MSESTQEVKRAVCTFCHCRCRVLVYSENGHLVKIEEDRSNPGVDNVFPPTRGCQRLLGAKEWLYHPDHLNYPVKRLGERGEGRWQKISWEQAFDEIAEKLKEIIKGNGAESIGITGGTDRTSEEFVARFGNLMGTPNIGGPSKICFAPCVVTGAAIFGWPMPHRSYVPLETGTKCMFLIGMDPSQGYQRLWKSVRDCKKFGVKLIVADPRKTETAELADLWLQLRPASDTALLMSMINVIIEEELYDKEFVDKWCYGFDKLVERAREYSPEKVADITWLPAEKIREAARMYATNRPSVSFNGMGTEELTNAVEGIQARMLMAAITGNIDVKGGQCLRGPAKCVVVEEEASLPEMLPPEQKAKQLGADKFKLLSWPGHDLIMEHTKKVWGKPFGHPRATACHHDPTLYRAIITGEPYPVKACISIAHNAMLAAGNTKLVYKALKSLELYVVLDFWMTPSAELADYVLPSASWLERPFFATGNIEPFIVAGEKALPSSIPGEYDHRTDYEICGELITRLGRGQYWPGKTLEEGYDYRLKPMGITFKEFMDKGGIDFPPVEYKKYEEIGFATSTGKVELYSTIFEKLGYDPLPCYEESHENPISAPELAKEYPLMLITGGRFRPMYHSEHRQVDSLRKKHPHPLLQVNPKTAAELNINDGDWAWIETTRGRIRMKCKYFEGIDSRVVHAEHEWWFPELPGEEPWLHGVWESNVNILTDDDPDVCNKLSGGWPLKTALCKIYKAKEY